MQAWESRLALGVRELQVQTRENRLALGKGFAMQAGKGRLALGKGLTSADLGELGKGFTSADMGEQRDLQV